MVINPPIDPLSYWLLTYTVIILYRLFAMLKLKISLLFSTWHSIQETIHRMFQPKSLYQLWCTTVHIVVYVYIFCIHSHYSALHPVPSQLYSFLKKASLWCPTYVHLFTNIQPMHEYHTGTQSCILCNSICAQLPIPCQTEAIYKAWLGVNIEWKCCARQGNKKLLIMLPFTETLLPREDMAPLRLSGSSFSVCIINWLSINKA